MNTFKPTKIGNTIAVSDEYMLMASWFPMKGHSEEIPLTEEDRAAHARAVLAYEECMSNPWINLSGYDYEFEVMPLEPRKRFIPEEIDAEHMARWMAAGRPMRNPVNDMLNAAILRSFDRTDLPSESERDE